MSKVIVRNLHNREVNISFPDKSLLHNLQEAYLDWMHTCGGRGRCTTCRAIILAIILDGHENITSLSKAEIKYKNTGKLRQGNAWLARVILQEIL